MSELARVGIQELIEDGDLQVNDGYRAKNSELSDHGIPFARAGNIQDGFHFAGADLFPTEDLGKVGFKISQPGDVVFTSKGTVGRFAFVRQHTPQFVYSPQLCFWRSLNPDRIVPRWLYYWMQGREFFEQYHGVADQTDMAAYVSLRDQRRMHITVLPQNSQQRIAHILGTLDDKIELNRRMNRTLEAIARAIFKSWFIDFLPVRAKIAARTQTGDPVHAKAEGREPVGMDPETAALFPDSFEDSPRGKIPKGWEVGRLGNIAVRRQAAIKPQDIQEGTPYVSLDDIPRGSIALSSWKLAEAIASSKSRFLQGDVLFGKLRPYFHKVIVAPIDGICSTDIVVVSPKRQSWSTYLLMVCSSKEFIAYNSAVMTGTKMPRTTWPDMRKYELVFPTDELLGAYDVVVQPMIRQLVDNIHESRQLSDLRDTLMPRLLSGNLDPPEEAQ